MYILSFAPVLFILYTTYNYCCRYKKKNIKKFDDDELNSYEFELCNTKFFHDTTELHRIDYSNTVKFYDKNTIIPLNYDVSCEYFIISYYYNYNEYKLLTKPKELTFPFYKQEQLKSYVYTNHIKKATLFEMNKDYDNNKDLRDDFMIQTYDILDELLPFLGPNYNFYIDLNVEMTIHQFVKYLCTKDPEKYSNMNLIHSKFHIELHDTFTNLTILNDKLEWNPVLQL